MTTSLPTTSSNEIFPGAAAPATGSVALADSLATLWGLGGSVAPADASAPLAPDFGALLGGDAAPAAAMPMAATPASVASSTSSESNPVVRPTAPHPISTQTPPPCVASLPTDARGLAMKPARVIAAPAPVGEAKGVSTVVAPEADAAVPDRATLEAIVALLAPLTMAFDAPPVSGGPAALNEQQPNAEVSAFGAGERPSNLSAFESAGAVTSHGVAAGAAGVGGRSSNSEVPPVASHEQDLSQGGAESLSAFGRASVTLTLPGQTPVSLQEISSPAALPSGTAPAEAEVAERVAAAKSAPVSPAASSPGAAASSRVAQPANIAAALPIPAVRQDPVGALSIEGELAASSDSDAPAGLVIEATASVELTNGAVVALALPSKIRLKSNDADSSGHIAADNPAASVIREKSAALPRVENASLPVAEKRFGKNFLSADGQKVTGAVAEAGIGVAQKAPTMLFTPHHTMPTVSATVPALVSMVAAAPEIAGAPGAEPMPQLVAASVARRAVETVTNVVEAQAVSKLQPVPSVQLKFKIGHEDLAVRVALRDGVVHTEFRTDSPELRAALQQEWKAVTAQPESALRYLDPVVSAASSSQSGTNSFAQQQQQSPGQSAAQQQQQQQQQNQQARAAAEFFGSVARSTPFQPRDGGAVANVAAAVLPTSVHLSAVA